MKRVHEHDETDVPVPRESGVRTRPSMRDSVDRYLADLDKADRITPDEEIAHAGAWYAAARDALVIARAAGLRLEADPERSSRDDVVRCVSRLWRLLDEHHEAHSEQRIALTRLVEEELGVKGEVLVETRAAMSQARRDAMRRRGIMTRANLALVVYTAKKYRNRGVPMADLIQEGNIALLHAVERFDPNHGTRLSTYASAWLHRSMQRTVRSLSRTVRLPESAKNAQSKSVPIDEPFGDQRLSLTDVLIEDEAIAPDDVAARQEIRAQAREFLTSLKPQEQLVVRRRFGIEHPQPATLREIGEELGITRERVRQIEKAALEKLRRRMRSLAEAS